MLDIDASDIPLHGQQERPLVPRLLRQHCYLPLYVFCGQRCCAAYLRPSRIDGGQERRGDHQAAGARLRQAGPTVRIIVRGDSGFCRQRLMRWCERSGVGYIVGLARNARLEAQVEYAELVLADQYERKRHQAATDRRVRLCGRQLGARAARDHAARVWRAGQQPALRGDQPATGDADALYDELYCQRGEAENRIKEAQLGLFGTRASCHVLRANQFRLLLAALAYMLMQRLRALALQGTELASGAGRHHPHQAAQDRRGGHAQHAAHPAVPGLATGPARTMFAQAMRALSARRTSYSAWPAR